MVFSQVSPTIEGLRQTDGVRLRATVHPVRARFLV